MSRIAKILNTYTNEQGDPEIHFVDDLGFEYTLEYRVEWILAYFSCGGGHPHYGELSHFEEHELYAFCERALDLPINPHFLIYVNADFMRWKAVVELEDAN
jgi:hypothetical protein